MYRKLNLIFQRYISKQIIYRFFFNYLPVYRRTNGKIMEMNKDLSFIRVRIKNSFRNRNYVGTMFGGSMFAAADPIFMIQFIELLGNDYVVWDRAGWIRFKRPAREDLWLDFNVEKDELQKVLQEVEKKGSYTFIKTVELTNKEKTQVYAVVKKELYVATKEFYKKSREEKKHKKEQKSESNLTICNESSLKRELNF